MSSLNISLTITTSTAFGNLMYAVDRYSSAISELYGARLYLFYKIYIDENKPLLMQR